MSQIVLVSDTLLTSPAVGTIEYNGQFYGTDSNAARAQMQRITQATAQASTSGTSITFTDIPAWAKKITVMFVGVSGSGTSNHLIQIGTSGSPETTGYLGASSGMGAAVGTVAGTTGFIMNTGGAAVIFHGAVTIFNATGNTWVASGVCARSDTAATETTAGSKTLSGALNMVRITTVGGTDTFDAGSVNILYEG